MYACLHLRPFRHNSQRRRRRFTCTQLSMYVAISISRSVSITSFSILLINSFFKLYMHSIVQYVYEQQLSHTDVAVTCASRTSNGEKKTLYNSKKSRSNLNNQSINIRIQQSSTSKTQNFKLFSWSCYPVKPRLSIYT